MTRRFRSLTATVAMATVATLVLPSCASRGAAEVTTDTEGRAVVRYLDYGASLTNLPVYQSQAAGYFDNEKIALESTTGQYSASQGMQALLQGEADIIVNGSTASLAAAGQGRDIKVVATIMAPAPFQLTVNRRTLDRLAAAGVTPTSPFGQKIAALRGMTLGAAAAGSTNDLLLRFVLTQSGINPATDVVLKPIADAPALVATTKQGAVDAFVSFPPQTLSPVTDGWGTVFIDFLKDAPQLVDMPLIDIVTTSKYLDKNRDVVKRFLVAVWRGQKDIVDGLDPQALQALHARFYDKTAMVTFTDSVAAIRGAVDTGLAPNPARYELLEKVTAVGAEKPISVPFETLNDTTLAKEVVAG